MFLCFHLHWGCLYTIESYSIALRLHLRLFSRKILIYIFSYRIALKLLVSLKFFTRNFLIEEAHRLVGEFLRLLEGLNQVILTIYNLQQNCSNQEKHTTCKESLFQDSSGQKVNICENEEQVKISPEKFLKTKTRNREKDMKSQQAWRNTFAAHV